MLYMTIPTANAHPQVLRELIAQSGLPPQRIVLVATRPRLDLPADCHVVEDLGPPNIQRWWNVGIDTAESLGATVVAVLNDDLRIAPETLPRLHDALRRTGAAIASPSRAEFPDGLHRGRLVPYAPRLWGALWVLDVRSGLRPDPAFAWWYGDNDLDIRARREYGGVVSVPVPYEHLHPGEGTAKSPELSAQAERDWITFETRYRVLLRRSRRVERWRKLMHR